MSLSSWPPIRMSLSPSCSVPAFPLEENWAQHLASGGVHMLSQRGQMGATREVLCTERVFSGLGGIWIASSGWITSGSSRSESSESSSELSYNAMNQGGQKLLKNQLTWKLWGRTSAWVAELIRWTSFILWEVTRGEGDAVDGGVPACTGTGLMLVESCVWN